MEKIFTFAALILIVIFAVMVAYTVYASLQTSHNRNTRLDKIQKRLAEIEAEKQTSRNNHSPIKQSDEIAE